MCGCHSKQKRGDNGKAISLGKGFQNFWSKSDKHGVTRFCWKSLLLLQLHTDLVGSAKPLISCWLADDWVLRREKRWTWTTSRREMNQSSCKSTNLGTIFKLHQESTQSKQAESRGNQSNNSRTDLRTSDAQWLIGCGIAMNAAIIGS